MNAYDHIDDVPVCADTDLDMWFPTEGGHVEPALRICLTFCAALDGGRRLRECAIAAQRDPLYSTVGVLGGTTSTDRNEWRQGRTTLDRIHRRNAARVGAQWPPGRADVGVAA